MGLKLKDNKHELFTDKDKAMLYNNVCAIVYTLDKIAKLNEDEFDNFQQILIKLRADNIKMEEVYEWKTSK